MSMLVVQMDEDTEQLLAEEAVRRDVEIDSGAASLRDAENEFRDAQSRLKE